jgi:hypothetical protein
MTTVTIDDFNSLLSYYRKEAELGHYHNPYDVINELNDIIRKLDLEIGETVELEDKADYVASFFWSM